MDNILPSNEKEQKLLFNYGLFILFYNLFTLLIVLLIGKIFNELFFTILLMLLYIPIRVIIGGYHCKKVSSCLTLFSIIIMSVIIFYKIDIKNIIFWWSIPVYFLTIYFVNKNNTKTITRYAMIFFIIECILSFSNSIFGSAAYYSVMLISCFYLIDIFLKNNI